MADFGLQFAAVLDAIPWISVETKKTAMEAMTDFWPGQEELEESQPIRLPWWPGCKSEDAGSEWKSSVGSAQAHVRKVEAGHGAPFPVVHLTGDTNVGIDFGQIMKPDFTICSVTISEEQTSEFSSATSPTGFTATGTGRWGLRTTTPA